MQLAWSRARPEWKGVFGGKPHTIGTLQMNNISIVDEVPQQQSDSEPLQQGVPSQNVVLLATTFM
jgi:hypothetical protein